MRGFCSSRGTDDIALSGRIKTQSIGDSGNLGTPWNLCLSAPQFIGYHLPLTTHTQHFGACLWAVYTPDDLSARLELNEHGHPTSFQVSNGPTLFGFAIPGSWWNLLFVCRTGSSHFLHQFSRYFKRKHQLVSCPPSRKPKSSFLRRWYRDTPRKSTDLQQVEPSWAAGKICFLWISIPVRLSALLLIRAAICQRHKYSGATQTQMTLIVIDTGSYRDHVFLSQDRTGQKDEQVPSFDILSLCFLRLTSQNPRKSNEKLFLAAPRGWLTVAQRITSLPCFGGLPLSFFLDLQRCPCLSCMWLGLIWIKSQPYLFYSTKPTRYPPSRYHTVCCLSLALGSTR